MRKMSLWYAVGRVSALFGLLGLAALLGPLSVRSANASGEAEPFVDSSEVGFFGLAVGIPGQAIESDAGAGAVGVLLGSSDGLSSAGNQVWHQDSPGVEGTAQAGDLLGTSLAAGDFNGDGLVDLAVGVPGKEVDGAVDAGAVSVLYGASGGLSSTGLVAGGSQVWHQNSLGIEGTAQAYDYWASAMAAGDFDGDGYGDLAVGVYNEQIEGWILAGAVNVLYGSPGGLVAARNQYWHQDSPDVVGDAYELDRFGYALAAGDWNGDGYADLAISAPGEDVSGKAGAGAVNVLYGSAGGLSASGPVAGGNQQWHQDSPDVAGLVELNDSFGDALAAGDLNGDGYDDLVVGVPYEDVGDVSNAGAIHVLYGSADGLSAAGNQYEHQDRLGIGEVAEANDKFGHALCTGDLDGDGYDDLAVGVPWEGIGTVDSAGAVDVLYGAPGGLSGAGVQQWHQDSPDVADVAEEDDSFGRSLASGDLNGDGYADLAVGVPWEAVDGALRAGAVNVLYGTAQGLSATGPVAGGNQIWHQNRAGVDGTAEADDWFGAALVALRPARHRVYLPVALR